MNTKYNKTAIILSDKTAIIPTKWNTVLFSIFSDTFLFITNAIISTWKSNSLSCQPCKPLELKPAMSETRADGIRMHSECWTSVFMYTYITRHTFLYLVFTVFANHVAGQPSVKRMLRFPVIWHRGKRPWNIKLKLFFLFFFSTSVFITTVPHFWTTVTKVTALKHVSHWQIINRFFYSWRDIFQSDTNKDQLILSP